MQRKRVFPLTSPSSGPRASVSFPSFCYVNEVGSDMTVALWD